MQIGVRDFVDGPAAEASAILPRLADAALAGSRDYEVFGQACEDLVEHGVPVLRGSMVTDFLHPTLEARVLRWVRGSGIDAQSVDRVPENAPASESWLRSPLYPLVQRRERLLRRRIDAASSAEFPVLGEFAEMGGVDYLALRQPLGRNAAFGEVDEVLTSWVTDRAGGFSDDHLALLERVNPHLVLAVGAVSNMWIARALLGTYLGKDAAQRVVAGNVVRGRSETTRRVIWYSDLRGFTRLTDTLPHSEILSLLNDYAEPLVDAITADGGEVLKFMGDGMLAVFGQPEPEAACAAALRAWERARTAADAVSTARSARGAAVTQPYLALHEGEVLYGNFGGRARLDFTVLGPAVNEAARIAALSRSLDQTLIVSDAFAETCGALRERLVALGRYALRGVGRPQMLWTLDPGPPA
jgi:adenylate cyclase